MAANPNFPSSTYAGKLFAEIMGPEVFDPAGLVDNDLATGVDKMKFKETILESDDTVVFQTPSALFNDQGTQASTGEVNLEVVPFEFHKQIELSTITSSWLSENLAPGSMEDYSYDDIVRMYLEKVYQPKWKQGASFLALNGKTGLGSNIGSITFSQAYSGLYPLLDAASGIRKNALSGQGELTVAGVTKGAVTTLTLAAGSAALSKLYVGNTISLRSLAGGQYTGLNVDVEILSVVSDTSIIVDFDSSSFRGSYTASSGRVRWINRSNIIQILSNHITRTLKEVRRAGGRIVVPQNVADEWQFAIADAKLGGGYAPITAETLSLVGERMTILDNAPANTIGTWTRNRVFYGYDMSDDQAYIQMLWQGQTGDMVYNLRGRNKSGVAITQKFQREIMYTTPNS